jgi:hypothetical protein
MTTKGIYIYGIVPNFYDSEMFRQLDNSGVYPFKIFRPLFPKGKVLHSIR